jgi:hypothetical protein
MIGYSHLLVRLFANLSFIPELQVEVLNHLKVENCSTTGVVGPLANSARILALIFGAFLLVMTFSIEQG